VELQIQATLFQYFLILTRALVLERAEFREDGLLVLERSAILRAFLGMQINILKGLLVDGMLFMLAIMRKGNNYLMPMVFPIH
jgi:hypothetical protein